MLYVHRPGKRSKDKYLKVFTIGVLPQQKYGKNGKHQTKTDA
jgi:hypothetical protein